MKRKEKEDNVEKNEIIRNGVTGKERERLGCLKGQHPLGCWVGTDTFPAHDADLPHLLDTLTGLGLVLPTSVNVFTTTHSLRLETLDDIKGASLAEGNGLGRFGRGGGQTMLPSRAKSVSRERSGASERSSVGLEVEAKPARPTLRRG